MHSTLRKKLGTPDLKTPSHFVGLKLKGCSLPYSNFGHVVLANPSPLLFYPISSTEVGHLMPLCIILSLGTLLSYLQGLNTNTSGCQQATCAVFDVPAAYLAAATFWFST